MEDLYGKLEVFNSGRMAVGLANSIHWIGSNTHGGQRTKVKEAATNTEQWRRIKVIRNDKKGHIVNWVYGSIANRSILACNPELGLIFLTHTLCINFMLHYRFAFSLIEAHVSLWTAQFGDLINIWPSEQSSHGQRLRAGQRRARARTA